MGNSQQTRYVLGGDQFQKLLSDEYYTTTRCTDRVADGTRLLNQATSRLREVSACDDQFVEVIWKETIRYQTSEMQNVIFMASKPPTVQTAVELRAVWKFDPSNKIAWIWTGLQGAGYSDLVKILNTVGPRFNQLYDTSLPFAHDRTLAIPPLLPQGKKQKVKQTNVQFRNVEKNPFPGVVLSALFCGNAHKALAVHVSPSTVNLLALLVQVYEDDNGKEIYAINLQILRENFELVMQTLRNGLKARDAVHKPKNPINWDSVRTLHLPADPVAVENSRIWNKPSLREATA